MTGPEKLAAEVRTWVDGSPVGAVGADGEWHHLLYIEFGGPDLHDASCRCPLEQCRCGGPERRAESVFVPTDS